MLPSIFISYQNLSRWPFINRGKSSLFFNNHKANEIRKHLQTLPPPFIFLEPKPHLRIRNIEPHACTSTWQNWNTHETYSMGLDSWPITIKFELVISSNLRSSSEPVSIPNWYLEIKHIIKEKSICAFSLISHNFIVWTRNPHATCTVRFLI